MRNPHRSLLILSVISAVAMTVAAAQNPNSTRPEHSDSALSILNQDFGRNPRLHNVRVEISDGYIHLTGSVELLEDANQAIKMAFERGLSKGVVSQIVVQSPKISDASLRVQLAEKVGALQLDSIRLRVRNGIVRVSGTIHEDKQREDVLLVISSTPGVKGVDDLMHLDSATNRPR
jgi:osmotically-inducible protein OsmY